MAERIVRVLVDDLDQTEIADGEGGSVKFALDDTAYTIDLSAGNKAKLEKALAPFIAAATRTSGPGRERPRGTGSGRQRRKVSRRKTRAGSRTTKSSSNAAIRSWAAENGHSVSAKGRISQTVVSAYKAAHSKTK